MKLVKLSAAAALSTALLASGVAGLSASAASGKIDDNNYGTTGDIGFKASEEIEKPVHPTDPTDPVVPNPEPGPGTNGPLSVDYVSSFNFGEQEISTQDKTYYAAAQTFTNAEGEVDDSKTSANYMQVTDKRGTSAGWALKVEQTSLFTAVDDNGVALTDTANPTLDGVSLVMKKGTTNSTSDSAAPVAKDVTISGVGTPQTILNAEAKSGTGTWTSTFGDYTAGEQYQGVELQIPGKVQTDAVKYQTELKWALESTPDNAGA